MDGQRFDNLARSLARGRLTRRRFLAGVAGGATAAILGTAPDDADARTCRGLGASCLFGGQCCSGTCLVLGLPPLRLLQCVCPPATEPCQGVCKAPADYQDDPANCGGCGVVCPRDQCNRAVCNAGVCGLEPDPDATSCDDGNACTTGDTCQDGVCAGTPIACPICQTCSNGACVADETQNNAACGADQICCGGSCISVFDPQNCGACGNACPASLPNAVVMCGRVTAQDDLQFATIGCLYDCFRDFSNCDGIIANGCETRVDDNPDNCGFCGVVCAPDEVCCGCTCFPEGSGSCSICPEIVSGRLIR